jgi:SagB-type dehydrogenase family enzyme
MGSEGEERAQKSNAGEETSNAWYLRECSRGEQLLLAGQTSQAAEVFEAILAMLGDAARYERAAVLGRLSHCVHQDGRPDLASKHLQEALDITAQIAPSNAVKELREALHAKLGDVLRVTGQYAEAREAYEAALAVAQCLHDLRGQALTQGQLGDWALRERQLEEALMRYRAALALFQQIGEPALEAVIWHQLGRVFHEQRQWDEAERHYKEAARLREAAGDWGGAAQVWSQLALLYQEAGQPAVAETWYRKTIDWIRQNGDPIQLRRHLAKLAALLQHQPGRLTEARHLVEQALTAAQPGPNPLAADSLTIHGILADIIEKEALTTADGARRVSLQTQASHYRQLQQYAPRLIAALARLGNEPSYARAVILGRLGRCLQIARRPALAIPKLREALAVAGQLARCDGAEGLRGTLHAELGDVLRATGQYAEAREAYEAALAIAQCLHDLRGQALTQGQLGDWALRERQLQEALLRYRAALALFQQIGEPALEAVTWHQLGRVFHEQRQWDEAERHYKEAARLREAAGDWGGAAQVWSQLTLLCQEAGRLEAAKNWHHKAISVKARTDSVSVHAGTFPAVEITLHEQLTTEYGLEPDLLIDGPHEHRITPWMLQRELLVEDLHPMLVPCARTYVDGEGAVRIALPQGEPYLERHPGCTIIRRLRREVAVSGNSDLVWRLIRQLDGSRAVGEILAGLPADERVGAARLLAALVATEAVDVSGRPIGRFLHLATKKAVLPAGGLAGDLVLSLATDGNYREYPELPRVTLNPSIPEALGGFHALTRARRSSRNYLGLDLSRDELGALLHTACGVTGTMAWAGRETKLRAYPSSGALYAVEIYPLVLRVEGLDPAVYHYRAVENVLETIRPANLDTIIGAMLPMERQMVSGAAAMICLTGNFPRHERKYGEGGYRMLVAEAGHISQNLVLAATALGLSARPFGGVFDGLINQDLGLKETQEEFLLSVLVGRIGGQRCR